MPERSFRNDKQRYEHSAVAGSDKPTNSIEKADSMVRGPQLRTSMQHGGTHEVVNKAESIEFFENTLDSFAVKNIHAEGSF